MLPTFYLSRSLLSLDRCLDASVSPSEPRISISRTSSLATDVLRRLSSSTTSASVEAPVQLSDSLLTNASTVRALSWFWLCHYEHHRGGRSLYREAQRHCEEEACIAASQIHANRFLLFWSLHRNSTAATSVSTTR